MQEISSQEWESKMATDITADQIGEEMAGWMREAAQPAVPGETVGSAIARAARVLRLKRGRVKKYWYREVTAPPAHEVDAVRMRIAQRRREERQRFIDQFHEERARYEDERAALLDDLKAIHPWLARLAPPPPPDLED